MQRIKQGSRWWNRRVKEIQEQFAVPITQCKTCGAPHHAGFACQRCEGFKLFEGKVVETP